MEKVTQSFGHALSGLVHALKSERNITLFLLGYIPVLIISFILGISRTDWIALLITGGLFLTIELLNTAMERLVDTLDDYQKQLLGSHFHLGLKMAKDVASAASLVTLLTTVAVIVITLVPHLPR